VDQPEKLARPILRSDRVAQAAVDQVDPPDVAERTEELPRHAEPSLGVRCLTAGDLDVGDPQAMHRCEPCQPVTVEHVPPSSLVLPEAQIVAGSERGCGHQGVAAAARY